MEQRLTAQSLTIILPKKQMSAGDWPRLHKAEGVVPFVSTDFTRWALEGDQSDDIIDARSDSSTKSDQDFNLVIFPQTTDKCDPPLTEKSWQNLMTVQRFSTCASSVLEK